MTVDETAFKIRDYLSRNYLFSDDGYPYGDDTSFIESGVIDSFGIVELLHWVEDEFDIRVADRELVPENFDSVAKLSLFIVGKQGAAT